MNINNGGKRFALLLLAPGIVTLTCLGAWAAADGPVADFPSFIPFDINKTGDVAVDKVGNVYVNLTERDGRDRIWKFSPAGEGPSLVADIGTGTAYGLAVHAEGDIYACKVGNGIDRGVYRVGRDGNPVRLPGTEQIVYPNALAFDRRGNLYVTESRSGIPPVYGQGSIWRIRPGGGAELWLRDDILTGTGTFSGRPVGANGIGYFHGDLYVLNYDKSLIVRIPVHPDGSPGQPDVWAVLQEVPESPFVGNPPPVWGDGLALDVHGNVYVAVSFRAAIVMIDAEDLSQETIAVFGSDPNAPLFAPLDTPNSLAFGTGKGGRQSLFVTNLGMTGIYFPPPAQWPGHGLVKIDAGVPGLPLP